MSEAERYVYYHQSPSGSAEVDPRILEYHECRTVLNLTPSLARVIWDRHLTGHLPIRVRGRVVIDGSVRVQAAILLGIENITVATHV